MAQKVKAPNIYAVMCYEGPERPEYIRKRTNGMCWTEEDESRLFEKNKKEDMLSQVLRVEKKKGGNVNEEDLPQFWDVWKKLNDESHEAYRSYILKPQERRGWWMTHIGERRLFPPVFVEGSLCDKPVRLLLDSGANASICDVRWLQKHNISFTAVSEGRELSGLGGKKSGVIGKIAAKISLKGKILYWMTLDVVSCIGRGEMAPKVILGTDFLVRAGVRLELLEGIVRIPNERPIPICDRGQPTGRVEDIYVGKQLDLWPGDSKIIKAQVALHTHSIRVRNPHRGVEVTVVRKPDDQTAYMRITNLSKEIRMLNPFTVIAKAIPLLQDEEEWRQDEVSDRGFETMTERQRRISLEVRQQWEKDIVQQEEHNLRNIVDEPKKPAGVVPKEILKREDKTVTWKDRQQIPRQVNYFESCTAPEWDQCSGRGSEDMSDEEYWELIQEAEDDAEAYFSNVPDSYVIQEWNSEQNFKGETFETLLWGISEDKQEEFNNGTDIEKLDMIYSQWKQDHQEELNMDIGLDPELYIYQIQRQQQNGEEQSKRYLEIMNDIDTLPEGISELPNPESLVDRAKHDIPDELIDVGEPDHPMPAVEQRFRELIKEYSDCFISDTTAAPQPVRGFHHEFSIKDVRPIYQKPRPVPPHLMGKLYEQIRKLLSLGLIAWTFSPWGSPIVIVMKKDGKSIRPCIDYRAVNALQELDRFPMPLIQDVMLRLRNAKWFLAMDMASGFWHIPLTQRTSQIAAFVCPLGHFAPSRMQFGMINAPPTFCMFGFVVFLCATIPFIDDISEGRSTPEDLYDVLAMILSRARIFGVTFSLSKCQFLKRKVPILANLIDEQGRLPIYKGVERLLKTNVDNITQAAMRSFIGSLTFHAEFIPNFAAIAAPIHALKSHDWIGKEKKLSPEAKEARAAVLELQRHVRSPSILFHPDLERPMVVVVVNTEWAIAGIIIQERDGHWIPVARSSRTLSQTERARLSVEREVIALLHMIKVFQHLLLFRKFQVWTAQSNLEWLLSNKHVQGKYERWAIILSAFKFKVMQKKLRELQPALGTLASEIDPCKYHQFLSTFKPPSQTILAEMQEVLWPKLPEITPDIIVGTFDGAAKRKESASSAGFMLWNSKGSLLKVQGQRMGEATVNEAEYHGLLNVLLLAKEMNCEKIIIFGDSRLVVEQVNGTMNTNQEHLKKLQRLCRKAIKQFRFCKIYQVPRKYNAAADRVASYALGQQEQGTINVPDEGDTEKKVLEDLNRIPEFLEDVKQARKTKGKEGIQEAITMVVTRSGRVTRQNIEPMGKQLQPRNASTSEELEVHEEENNDQDERPDHEVNEEQQEDVSLNSERRCRIRLAQEKVPWMKDCMQLLKGVTIGRQGKFSKKMTRNFNKRFTLAPDGILVKLNDVFSRSYKAGIPQVVIPPELRDDMLHAAHSEVTAGHLMLKHTYARLSRFAWWPGMYRDTKKYVEGCVQCQTGKGVPRNKAPMRQNLFVMGPLHGISMDIVIIKVQQVEHVIIVYQDLFTRYVWMDRVEDSTAETCALSYMRTIIAQVGASRVLRIDRDRRWLSVFFQALCRHLGQRQRATLAYRPQGNASNERVHPVIYGSLKMFCEEIDMSDWKWKYAHLTFALNTAWNIERIETSFYLMHGWDPMSPMEAMMGRPAQRYTVKQEEARDIRYAMQRDVQKARKIVQEIIQAQWIRQIEDYEDKVRGTPFKVNERVWLYVSAIPRNIPKKLAHKWHGPFRVLEVYDGGIYYRIELSPGYGRIFDKVHFDRLKRCYDAYQRPEGDIEDRSLEVFDFDEALLPEDSFEPDEEEGIFEVEKILDRRIATRTRSGITRKEYLIKWKGYHESFNTWEPESGLSCGGLIYDFDREWEKRQRVNSLTSMLDEDAEVHWGTCHTATLTSFKEEGNKEEVNSGANGKAGERGCESSYGSVTFLTLDKEEHYKWSEYYRQMVLKIPLRFGSYPEMGVSLPEVVQLQERDRGGTDLSRDSGTHQ